MILNAYIIIPMREYRLVVLELPRGAIMRESPALASAP
jgi:hypothetical protein